MDIEAEVMLLRKQMGDMTHTVLTAKLLSEENSKEIALLRDTVMKIQIKVAGWSSVIGIGSAVLTAMILKYIG